LPPPLSDRDRALQGRHPGAARIDGRPRIGVPPRRNHGAMTKYIIKRILLMLPTLFGVAVLIFFLMRVVPGDIVELRFAGESSGVSQETLNIERARLGLDKPLWKQFLTWMGGIARFDFGTSMWTGAPISEEIKLRFA